MRKNRTSVKAAALAVLLALTMMLMACSSGFVCDFCNQKSRGEKYNLTAFGRGYVCEDCYNLLWGRAG